MKKTVAKKLTPTKKSSSPRHFAHVGRAIHHHKAHAHMPKFFYHKGSLFPSLTWKISFVTLIVFFLGYFIVNNLPETDNPTTEQIVTPESFTFVFSGKPEDWGVDPDSLRVHGAAANEFDFLFQEDTTDQTNIPTQSTGIILSSGSTKDDLASDTELGGPSISNSGTTTVIAKPLASCKTPWGDIIQDGDFVLAYKQRTDVNDLCNVQKRYCTNGTLNGSYLQSSCKEDLEYSYTKVIPVVENDPDKVDPYIQPSQPRYSGANFDNNGKITPSTSAKDTWSDSGKSPVVSTGPYITQIVANTSSCTAPWGVVVPEGQFVKAYKSPVGLKDMPCEVQIRMCYKGTLKGSFKYSSCNAKNMTYSDYLLDKGEDSDTPNIIDMANTVMTDSQKESSSSPGFWKWFSKYF